MSFRELYGLIDPQKKLVIQMHDFPDHDAVASAFGLRGLFLTGGIRSTLCYGGYLQSRSLEDTVERLGIPMIACSTLDVLGDPQIVLVDGLVGNRNVSVLRGNLIGIIDHHQPSWLPDIPFRDIRSNYGSCSTIIYEYYQEIGQEPDRNTATALLMGIMMDTGFLTRGVSRNDLDAFSRLFFAGDWEAGSSLLKNSISIRDLEVFSYAIDSCILEEDICFIFVERSCSPELTAIIADFFLRLREVDFVVVVISGIGEYRLSIRSEDRRRPADIILQKALAGLGSGGGHIFMAGGTIPEAAFPGKEILMGKFLDVMKQIKGSLPPI